MSNIFQIKRGSSKPDGKLAPYELGIDTRDGQLYFGGAINDKEYGQAQGIKVATAEKAGGAIKIIDANGNGQSVGSATGPIYLSDGAFLACGDGTTMPGTIEYAKALNPGAEIIADLEANNAAMFNGTASNQATSIGTKGILPIEKGGTGAASKEQARNNLGIKDFATLEQVPIANGGTGATTAEQARSNLGIKPFAAQEFVPIANGGTGATKAAEARKNLGTKETVSIITGYLSSDGQGPSTDITAETYYEYTGGTVLSVQIAGWRKGNYLDHRQWAPYFESTEFKFDSASIRIEPTINGFKITPTDNTAAQYHLIIIKE